MFYRNHTKLQTNNLSTSNKIVNRKNKNLHTTKTWHLLLSRYKPVLKLICLHTVLTICAKQSNQSYEQKAQGYPSPTYCCTLLGSRLKEDQITFLIFFHLYNNEPQVIIYSNKDLLSSILLPPFTRMTNWENMSGLNPSLCWNTKCATTCPTYKGNVVSDYIWQATRGTTW